MTTRRYPQMVEADLTLIARYYLRGYGVGDIAKRLREERHYPHSDPQLHIMVSKGLKELHERWLHSQLLDFDAAKARELAKIDKLEQAYWDGWDRSRLNSTHTETEMINDTQGENGQYSRARTMSKSTDRDGTAEFLRGIERCIEMRCKILGLFDATKIAFTDWKTGAQEIGMTETEAAKEFEALVNKFTTALDK